MRMSLLTQEMSGCFKVTGPSDVTYRVTAGGEEAA
jgi:hypothetical protein